MEPLNWVIGSLIALIGAGGIGALTWRSQNRVHEADATEMITDAAATAVGLLRSAVADLEERVAVLEREVSACEDERLVLLRWNTALVEQVVLAGRTPVTIAEIRADVNGGE